MLRNDTLLRLLFINCIFMMLMVAFLPSREASLNSAASEQAAQPEKPLHRVQISAVPNDPFHNKQSYLQQIHAEEAWNVVKQNKAVTVALVDTGVDLNHPDLKANLVPGVNLLDPSLPPQDDNGHGTNVAGIIGAIGDNQTGVSGILWAAKIMPIKALQADGSGDEDKLGQGIRYAVDHGANIVVLSLGLYRYSSYLSDIVQYAEDHNVLLVAATGNDGKDVKYPAAYPTVLAVGGIASDNQEEPQSNHGLEIDVVAPWYVYTTAKGGGYAYNSGTSMAAPQVAAVAALIWAKYPEMKAYQVRNMIRQSAQEIGKPGWNSDTGYGLLRADRALTLPYTEDMYENNETRETAKPISVEKMISAVLSGGGDQDWFKLDAPYDGYITLQFTIPSNESIEAVHYIGNSDKAVKFTNITNQSVRLEVSKGANYLQLHLSGKTSKSIVKYKMQPSFTMKPDAFEDNDRMYKAYTLPLRSQTITGNFHKLDDQDWFELSVDQPGTLQVKVTTDTMRIDPLVKIQKAGEKALTIDQGGEGDSEYSQLIDVLPGNYYILVNNAVSEKAEPVVGQYQLNITYKQKLTDPNEPNNRPYEATPMNAGIQYPGMLDTAEDTDWFQLKLTQTSLVSFALDNLPSDRSVSMAIFDSSQKQIVQEINSMGTSKLRSEQPLTAGTYYVKLASDQPFQQQMYVFSYNASVLVAGFTDIANHWAVTAIANLQQRGIITGYPGYSFKPEDGITRAEAAALFAKVLRLPITNAAVKFKDVKPSHWAYNLISAASQAGVIAGYPDGSFAPDRMLSRVEMAVMMARAIGMISVSDQKLPFTDISEDYWALSIIQQMKSYGWISGYSDGSFQPNRGTTRAEFSYFIYKALPH